MNETNKVENDIDRQRRWRLILGSEEQVGVAGWELTGSDQAIDRALSALYDVDRSGGLGGSAPHIARWLGDIRTFFPSSVVRIMQQDALERLNLRQMLLQPELLEAVEPDVHLVANLLSLSRIMPEEIKATARLVVRKVVDELESRLASPLHQAVTGALNRSARNLRPRYHEINWPRTIRANLKYYQPAYGSILPVTRIGYGHMRSSLRDLILCIDESGSMATSVVYSGIFGSVLASLRALKTHVVVFDTEVVDLSEDLGDPVELLFGIQLGGGTDINRALSYCQSLIRQPQDTILILISDLYEGGNSKDLLKRAATLVASGVQVITLLALDDRGAPVFEHNIASALADLGIPVFACTPDLFPDLMAHAIQRLDIYQWAALNNVVTARGSSSTLVR